MILFLQIIAVVVAIFSFQMFPIKTAGIIAGSCFVAVAIYSVIWSYRKRGFLSISMYIWVLFLLFFAIPMFAVRFYYGDLPISEISIGSVSFTSIHKASERVYTFAFLASVIDYWRAKRRKAT